MSDNDPFAPPSATTPYVASAAPKRGPSRAKFGVAAALVGLCGIAVVGWVKAGNADERADDLSAQVVQMTVDVDSLGSELGVLTEQTNTLGDDLASVQAERDTLEDDVAALEAENAALATDLETAENDLSDSEYKLAQLEASAEDTDAYFATINDGIVDELEASIAIGTLEQITGVESSVAVERLQEIADQVCAASTMSELESVVTTLSTKLGLELEDAALVGGIVAGVSCSDHLQSLG